MNVDLREFLAAVVEPAGTDAHAWIAHFKEAPGPGASWRGYHCAPADAPKLNGSSNAYFSVAAFNDDAPARKAEHAIGVTCIVADDVGVKARPEDVLARLGEPSWIIATSPNNEQWGFLLDAAYQPDEAVPVYAELARLGLSDKSGHGPVRYARLPAGFNNKPGLSEPFHVELKEWHPERRISLEAFAAKLRGSDSATDTRPRRVAEVDGTSCGELIRLIVSGESYHDALRDFAAKRAARGESEASILETLRGAMLAAEPHDERWKARYDDLQRLVSSAVEKYSPPKRAARVILRAGNRPENLDELRAALVENAEAESLFVYAGALSRPYLGEAPGFGGSSVPVLEISRRTSRALAEDLGRIVDVRRIKVVKGGGVQDVASDVPTEYAQTIIDTPDRWAGIPVIERIVEAPLFIDGELHARSGYHPKARAWVQAPVGVKLDANLTMKGAAAALARINAYLDEFPFATPTDRAAAVSFLFLAAMRGSLPTAPGFAIDAPEYGSGKSTLTTVAHVIHAGRRPAVITLSRGDPEELRKAIDAVQLAGRSALIIDNATNISEADALAQLLTEYERLFRVLGVSQMVRCPCMQLVAINGVNLGLGNDMVRRIVPSRLNPGMERPEQKQFKRPTLVDDVIRDRAAILSDIFSVIAAYRASGARAKTQVLVGYPGFIETCVAPLVWLGMADPLAGMERLRVEDPTKAALREVVGLWRKAWGGTAVATRDLLRGGTDFLNPGSKSPALDATAARELVVRLGEIVGVDRHGMPDPKRVGEWLAKMRGRVVDGASIERGEADTDAKVGRWLLCSLPAPPERVPGPPGTSGDLPNPTRRENPEGGNILSPAMVEKVPGGPRGSRATREAKAATRRGAGRRGRA